MPLSTWFWAAFLVTSLTPGMSAVQLQRQLGINGYETAFQILHKLRSSMAITSGRIGLKTHVEIDETWIGGRTRGKGRGVHDQVCRGRRRRSEAARHETRARGRQGEASARRTLRGSPASRDRSRPHRQDLQGFVESTVDPATEMVVTDAWQGYARPRTRWATNISRAPSAANPTLRRTTCRSST